MKLSLPHCPLFSCFTCHSSDGVIKIWDRDKTLLREIIMDDTLTVASFLNQRGKNYFFTPNTLLKPCALLICCRPSLGDLQCPADILSVSPSCARNVNFLLGQFNWFDTKFPSFISFLPPQGFGPEAKTRGGILGFPACIHIRNFKMYKESKYCK